jgi:hypothetical protein
VPVDVATTGVQIYSLAGPVQVTTTNNKIFDDQNGTWVDSPPVSAAGTSIDLLVQVTNDLVNAWYQRSLSCPVPPALLRLG